MFNKVFLFLGLAFGTAFFGNGGIEAFSGTILSATAVSACSLSSSQEDDLHSNRHAISCFSGAMLTSACLSSENQGGRNLPSSGGRLASSIFPLSRGGYLTRAASLLYGDLRAYYGPLRTHLFLCRFLI